MIKPKIVKHGIGWIMGIEEQSLEFECPECGNMLRDYTVQRMEGSVFDENIVLPKTLEEFLELDVTKLALRQRNFHTADFKCSHCNFQVNQHLSGIQSPAG